MRSGSVVLLGSLAVACTVLPARPAQAGEQVEGMIEHNRSLMKILETNVSLCKKAFRKVKAYHKKNAADFARKKKQTRAYLRQLSPADQRRFTRQYASRVQDMVMELLPTSLKFQENCPKQTLKLADTFHDFDMAMDSEHEHGH